VAVALAIINVMWLESNYAFGQRNEKQTRERFENASRKEEADREG
ncbi:MAG TPA: cytochrome bd-I oxidase subunit CydX, partial [Janthinobacterium sp.]|nr:cytochrome bd-I oxidase subunit CydX [Janthinobacterium sp.]